MGNIAISCKGIKKSYGKNECRIQALKGIDIEVYENQLTLLVGPSGCGKSTLLSIMMTILTPDEGELLILGKNPSHQSENEKALIRNRDIGIVFQSLYLIPTLTLLENIALPLMIAGEDKLKANKKAFDILKLLHLEERAHFSPLDLSRGQQQRIAIGRAMVNDSKIILCDEPTSSLDQHSGLEVMQFLRDLAKGPRAIFVVTHDQRIFPFADRIIMMNDGLITEEAHYA